MRDSNPFIFSDVTTYLLDTLNTVRPFLVAAVSFFNFVIFPNQAYVPPAIALGGVIVLDIITKYYALSHQYGGLRKAITDCHITSDRMWAGTRRKIVGYLVIMILTGLSFRVTVLPSLAYFLSNIAYTIMFLREAQSVIENLIAAGHDDLNWVLSFLKKKETKVKEEIIQGEVMIDELQHSGEVSNTESIQSPAPQDAST